MSCPRRAAVLLACLLLGSPLWAEQPPLHFTVAEAFGVDHPDQIIDFDLDQPVDPAQTRVVGPEGEEVPYQLLEGGRKLAVRTALAANETRTWTLQAGAPRVFPAGVIVTERPDGWELTNGLTGVRLPKLEQTPDRRRVLAPIQGIQLRDGTWAATGPNWLFLWIVRVRTTSVRFLERGPLKVVAQVTYQCERPPYTYGQVQLAPAGEGFYTSTITLEAGQPSVLIEEETNLNIAYSLDFYQAVHPTQARYRGHHADSKELGVDANGQVYGSGNAAQRGDAQVDLRYDRNYPSSYYGSVGKEPAIRRLALWDPWVVNGGWYWEMYDATAGPSAPVVGIFAGRASRALGAHASGPGFYTRAPANGQGPGAGITVVSERRSPDARVILHSRFQWGLFVSTVAEAIKPPNEVQPIGRQMNLHGGFNLNKIYRYVLDFADPPGGYGAMYMQREAVDSLIARLRADRSGKYGGGFYSWLYNADPTARDLIDFWYDTTGQQAAQPVAGVLGLARNMLRQFIWGDGIYSFQYAYWHGGLEMSRALVRADQLLGSNAVSAEDKRRLKAAVVLFASVLLDNDFVPMDNCESFNLGTANMPVQQENYREMYELYLAFHPMMAGRVEHVAGNARQLLQHTISETGAHMGSLHYVGASNGPLLATLQQLQMRGLYDAFREEPRLARFAEFYLQALTPPEVRFGGRRKMPAIGDGATEGSEEYGMLATGFAQSQPELSARLMGAWREQGRIHSGFHGTTLLKIDDRLPGVTPHLGDARFPGYFSVLRSGWGTPWENAIWCVNGNFYSDHAHSDMGSLVIYALGAPLCVDWGSFYYPSASGGVMHSTVISEADFGQPWEKDITNLQGGGGFSSHYGTAAEATLLDSQPAVHRAVSTLRRGSGDHQTTWVRTVTLVSGGPVQPLIFVRDTFQGAEATSPKIWSLNLMAEGAVQTPAGNMVPPARTYGAGKQELPSAGPVFPLTPGVHRLGFTGQHWQGHPTGGIDWDVYLLPQEPQQAQIGNWGHTWSSCADEFRAAQHRPFEERQHILRVQGTGAFTAVILPWPKGQRPEGLAVGVENEQVVVRTAAGELRIRPDGTCDVPQ